MSLFRVVLIISVLGAFTSCDQWSLREVEKRGQSIREVLERFHTDAGSYPAALDALTTRYGFQIPAPTVGSREWNYEVFNNRAAYALSVRIKSPSEPLLQATSESGWVFDTK